MAHVDIVTQKLITHNLNFVNEINVNYGIKITWPGGHACRRRHHTCTGMVHM